MRLAPDSLPGRALSLGILALGLGLIWFAVFAPLFAAAQARAGDNALLKTRYEKLQALVAKGFPEAGLETLEAPLILEAQSQAGAQASLQSLARTIALSQGMNVRSISAINNDGDATGTVSILISAETDLAALVNFLYRVSASEENMWARDLSLRSNEWQGTDSRQPARLEMRVVIEAPWQPVSSEAL